MARLTKDEIRWVLSIDLSDTPSKIHELHNANSALALDLQKAQNELKGLTEGTTAYAAKAY